MDRPPPRSRLQRLKTRRNSGLGVLLLLSIMVAVGVVLGVIVVFEEDGSITFKTQSGPEITAQITGEVNMPGTYTLPPGQDRVSDLFLAAGGATSFADLSGINMAALLEDAQQIDVPTKCFNINTATVEELDLFPRIGPSRADDIVAHRRSNGPFETVENLTDVRGIGTATLAEIQESICLVAE